MILWIDAQLSPAIATWINRVLAIAAVPLRDIGLRDSTDREIFLGARREGAIVMTKDADFVRLLADLGAPPKVIWVTYGNTSNAYLRQILPNALPRSLETLQSGDDLVEIS
jgi:predicted nuclease of predicted toxin-antitoxin system